MSSAERGGSGERQSVLEQAACSVFTVVATILLELADYGLLLVLILLDHTRPVRIDGEASARHHDLRQLTALWTTSGSRLADVALLSPLHDALIAKRMVTVDQQAERLLRSNNVLQADAAQFLLSRLRLNIVILFSVPREESPLRLESMQALVFELLKSKRNCI